MEIERIPGKLLFEHNCVIVPGFGGFIANPNSAIVHPGRHTFNPPYKAVLFNRSLTTNDGLLVNEVASINNIGFNEAMITVSTFVENANKAIQEKGKVVFPELGYLHTDVEGNILFTQDEAVNFSLESFGLGEFQSLPVIKTERGTQRSTVKVDRTPQTLTKAKPKAKNNIVAAGTALALFFAVASFFANFGISGNDNFANLAFWRNNSPAIALKWPAAKPDFTTRVHVELDSLTLDSITKAKAALEQLAAPAVEEVKPTVVEAPVSQGGKYFVIAGCFEDMANARKYVSILKGDGLDALIADKKNTKLYKVYLASFDKMGDAKKYVSTLADSVAANVWIYTDK